MSDEIGSATVSLWKSIVQDRFWQLNEGNIWLSFEYRDRVAEQWTRGRKAMTVPNVLTYPCLTDILGFTKSSLPTLLGLYIRGLDG